MDPDEPETESERRRANMILLVGALVIVGGGIWLVNAMVDARKSEECFEVRSAQLRADQRAGAQLGGPRATSPRCWRA